MPSHSGAQQPRFARVCNPGNCLAPPVGRHKGTDALGMGLHFLFWATGFGRFPLGPGDFH